MNPVLQKGMEIFCFIDEQSKNNVDVNSESFIDLLCAKFSLNKNNARYIIDFYLKDNKNPTADSN